MTFSFKEIHRRRPANVSVHPIGGLAAPCAGRRGITAHIGEQPLRWRKGSKGALLHVLSSDWKPRPSGRGAIIDNLSGALPDGLAGRGEGAAVAPAADLTRAPGAAGGGRSTRSSRRNLPGHSRPRTARRSRSPERSPSPSAS